MRGIVESGLVESGLAERSDVLAAVLAWARSRADVLAVAVVGSVARGAAKPESDLDFVVLVDEPSRFRDDGRWLAQIHFGNNAHLAGWHDVDYGVAWSRHVRLSGAGEVEFTFGALSWAATDPIDPGTAAVIADGCHVIFDSAGLFARLLAAATQAHSARIVAS